jgi:hypothetical protein
MARFTLDISDELNNQITRLALLSNRSKNKQIKHLLEQALKEYDKPRYILNHSGMCHNGTHNFKSNTPEISEFCNCGMYVLGELRQ